jgi:glycogen debranching enzyme
LDDVIRVEDQYYILSTSSLADDRTRVLKHGESFAVFDRRGDIEPIGRAAQGVYHRETRYLSQWVLRLGRDRPLLLSSAVRDDNAALAVDLTNPDIQVGGQVVTPRGALHISRTKLLWRGALYEELKIVNYSLSLVEVSLSLQFDADFADIFEVRGMRREHRGLRLDSATAVDQVTLAYEGLDGRLRRSVVRCVPPPKKISASEISLEVSLQPKRQMDYWFTVECDSGGEGEMPIPYEVANREGMAELQAARLKDPQIYTANEQFNDWVNRSSVDLNMMMTNTPDGPYPYAGVPWFSTAFGRDGIITALETLWLKPSIAHGVLSYLAATQATETIPEIDAEPGKILHETRKGEMAALKEVPFGTYYGSVDATPLFIMLAGAYYKRTADLVFIEHIWPNVEAALRWIDDYGDSDGDGFVEYKRHSATGLIQQGWKDSNDSVFHADGTLAEGPIALCEVQAYCYAAKRQGAKLASALGKAHLAAELKAQAKQLQRQFEEAYWCEDLSTYALALDGRKRACRVRASNAGHCLFAGIADGERARLVADTLLESDFFSGWGIRTLSSLEVRYNPMSYHNGSVWPHDNAMISWGMARYGFREGAAKVMAGLLDATLFFQLHRLPELFCGFDRRPGEGPTHYPVACSPQSWAAAAVFLMLEGCLGITIRGMPPVVHFRRTMLPEVVQMFQIKRLEVGSATVDLAIQRAGESVNVTVLRKQGRVDIVSVK